YVFVLVPRLRARRIDRHAVARQYGERIVVDLAGGETAGAECLQLAGTEVIGQRFGNDRAAGIAGAEKQHTDRKFHRFPPSVGAAVRPRMLGRDWVPTDCLVFAPGPALLRFVGVSRRERRSYGFL